MPSFILPLVMVLVPLVGLASLHLFLPVMAPLLTEASGVEPTAFGLVAGAVGLGSIWFYTANHSITPALGPVRTLQVGVVLVAIGAALIMSANFPLVLIGATMLGFGYATTTPAGSQIMANHAPKEYWSTLFSLRQAGVPLGGMIAGAVGGWLVAQFGWRMALVAIVLIGIASSLPLLWAPRDYNEPNGLRPLRLANVVDPTNLRRPFQAIALAPGLTRLALACIGFAMMQSATFSFFVIYLHDGLGYGLALAGTLFAVLQAASVMGRVAFGVVADRIGSPRLVLIGLSLGSATAALLLAGLGPGLGTPVLVMAALFVGISVATWNGLYLGEAARLSPPNSVSETAAGTTFFVFLVYTVTPPIFGFLINRYGYSSAFLMSAAGAAFSCIVLLLGGRAEPVPRRDKA